MSLIKISNKKTFVFIILIIKLLYLFSVIKSSVYKKERFLENLTKNSKFFLNISRNLQNTYQKTFSFSNNIQMNFTKTKINLNYLNIKNQTLCKNNPILDLLPKDLYSDVLELINDIPIQTDSDICKLSNSDVKYSSCCNKNIIEIFMTFFTEKMIKIKNEIFSKNIFFFSEILSEHNRNFIDGFGLDSSNFLILFKDFIDYKNEIYSLSKIIVEDSLKYFWSSLCNYVCREDNFKLFQVKRSFIEPL